MRVEPWALLLMLFSAAVIAAEELPTPELLDFLGSFETAEGTWVAPTELELPVPEDTSAQAGGQEK